MLKKLQLAPLSTTKIFQRCKGELINVIRDVVCYISLTTGITNGEVLIGGCVLKGGGEATRKR